MSAMPLEDLTPEQARKLAEFEAAPAAPESVRFRVALAMAAVDQGLTEMDEDGWDYYLDAIQQDEMLRLADAAIAVLRGPTTEADKAVERVLALADELDGLAQVHVDSGLGGTHAYWHAARLVRAAIRGDR